MRWLRDAEDPDWMVKTASTPAERRALDDEIGGLRRVAHPGVVELGPVIAGPDGLLTARTRYVGSSLAELAPLGPAEVAGLGAALATILADLHDLGLAHGRLGADHVLLDPRGRPVLCGFGCEPPPRDAAPEDVEALRRLLAAGLAGPAPARLAKLLTPSSRRHRNVTARALAGALARCQPDVRLPVVAPASAPPTERPAEAKPPPSSLLVKRHPLRAAADDDPADDPGRRPVAMAVAALVLVFVVGVAAVLTFTGHHREPDVVACPAADDGCTPIAVHDGVFVTAAGRFAIDLTPVDVVVGRWRCQPEGLPAALDPATGQIWAWRTWPGSRVVSAQALAHIPGASGLDVEPETSGCDRLIVRRGRAAPVVVRVPSRA